MTRRRVTMIAVESNSGYSGRRCFSTYIWIKNTSERPCGCARRRLRVVPTFGNLSPTIGKHLINSKTMRLRTPIFFSSLQCYVQARAGIFDKNTSSTKLRSERFTRISRRIAIQFNGFSNAPTRADRPRALHCTAVDKKFLVSTPPVRVGNVFFRNILPVLKSYKRNV
jgi:hypothetical protein